MLLSFSNFRGGWGYHFWDHCLKQNIKMVFKILVQQEVNKPKRGFLSIPKTMFNSTRTKIPSTCLNFMTVAIPTRTYISSSKSLCTCGDKTICLGAITASILDWMKVRTSTLPGPGTSVDLVCVYSFTLVDLNSLFRDKILLRQ